MNQSPDTRTKMELANEMLALTKRMAQNLKDAEFLVDGVEKRQALMDAFDRITQEQESAAPPNPQMLRTIFTEIQRLDTAITASLLQHREQAKARLANSNQQNKVLAYTNNAMSASGSYMDYRK